MANPRKRRMRRFAKLRALLGLRPVEASPEPKLLIGTPVEPPVAEPPAEEPETAEEPASESKKAPRSKKKSKE